ncbi:MAG TPA: GAF domain-containing protein [Candidatus Thermoplasmatota archaeon]|nr:GAF domain-containing protein [Candidatus Thermoplasmatota archaeon]
MNPGIQGLQQLRAEAPTGSHVVQFYRSDDFLLDQVARFLRPGLAAGGPAIVICTPAHRDALLPRLGSLARADLLLLDAEETLARFMVGDSPDPGLFDAVVGRAVRAAASRGQPVWAFGEMVAILVARGIPQAAIRLEQLWNELGAKTPLSLLCAYPIAAFASHGGSDALQAACATHTELTPPQDQPEDDPQALRQYIAVLQQRSAALNLEVARRREAEKSLAHERAELADFLENAIEGLHRVAADGTILWANRAELEMLGYTAQEYIGRNIADFHVDAPVIQDILDRSLRGEPIMFQEARLRHRDGSIRHVLIHSNSRHEGGRLLYTRCFTRDVTDRVELAAERHRASEARRLTQEVLEQRTLQQATIARLGQEALASRDLARTLDLLVREAGAALGLDLCTVLELGADRTAFTVRAGFGWPAGVVGKATISARSDSQAGYTLLASAPVVSPDLRSEARFTVQPLLLEHGAVSGMSVILHGQQEPWGVLGAHSRKARAFSEDDVNFLQAVANLMASAIERDRVESTLRRRSLQQAAVAQLGQRALTSPRLDPLFAEAVRDVAQTLEVEFCKVLQLEPDRQVLRLRAGVGWDADLVGTAQVPAGMDSQAGFTLNSQGPVIVSDLRTETRFRGPALLHDHGIVSGMSVVIPGGDHPFGVLGAHSRAARVFTKDDINFLQAVANLLAAAVERHRAERELRRHRDDLEGLVEERTALLAATNRELEAFSYTISHDLRAPLRGIDGLSKLLTRKHGDALPPEAKEMLRLVGDGAVRMGSLIESVLSLSRLGRVSLTHVPVDVSGMATSILGSLQAGDPHRKVAWTVEPGLRAVGDEGLLRLMLENLLGNAWKFTGRTEAPRITVAREAGGFRVEDNGAGFDMAHARELFQPFHRLHAPDEFEGSGIGLATVNRIVRRHGGRVWAQGTPGKGATFCVMLPQEPPAAVASSN